MLRLTGGEFKGRSIQAPAHQNTRPTQARLRQALFNSLQMIIGDAQVLDLFAGSGALGFEALSRGAAQVTFVELNVSTAKIIEKNAHELKVKDRCKIIIESVEKVWPTLEKQGPFDIILVDPPYSEGWEEKLLKGASWKALLATDGRLCLEWGRLKSKIKDGLPEQIGDLVKVREKIYGDSVLTTFQLS